MKVAIIGAGIYGCHMASVLSQFGFDLKEHLEVIVLGIVLVTTAPVLAKMIVGSVSEKK